MSTNTVDPYNLTDEQKEALRRNNRKWKVQIGPPVITIFVRQSADCKYRGDEFEKRCRCPKHLRWSHERKQHRLAAGTRSWSTAENKKRELEDQLAGRAPAKEEKGKQLDEAVKTLIQDKRVQGIGSNVLGKYTRELGRFVDFCKCQGVYTVDGITRELLTQFCVTWETQYPSSTTRRVVRDRLRSFLLYCFQAQWIDRAPQIPKIKLEYAETMPLTAEEYTRLLDTVFGYEPESNGDKGRPSGWTHQTRQRVHALFQLMRWSGLRISDALTLERGELQYNEEKKLYRILRNEQQKTGQFVYIPIPEAIAKELLEVLNGNQKYFFWSGNGQPRTITQDYGRYIRPIFKAAGLDDGQMKAHRLRDTFAVDLLEKGVSLEDVSKLLGHTSIKTTEKHYAKWVKARQDRLDSLVRTTWKPTLKKRR
jgi:integrase/recombinase XerD